MHNWSVVIGNVSHIVPGLWCVWVSVFSGGHSVQRHLRSRFFDEHLYVFHLQIGLQKRFLCENRVFFKINPLLAKILCPLLALDSSVQDCCCSCSYVVLWHQPTLHSDVCAQYVSKQQLSPSSQTCPFLFHYVYCRKGIGKLCLLFNTAELLISIFLPSLLLSQHST